MIIYWHKLVNTDNLKYLRFLKIISQFYLISEADNCRISTIALLRPEEVAIKLFRASNLEMEKFNLVSFDLLLVSIIRSWSFGKTEAVIPAYYNLENRW